MTATTVNDTLDARKLLMERARSLEPLITGMQDEIEAGRRLPLPIVRAMVEAGLFKMWAPKNLGGFELDPASYLDVIAEVARYDGAAGWNLMLSSSFGIFAGYLPDDVCREIYADPGSILCGQINGQGGKAMPVAGGYRVNGDWAFASGILQSTWVVSGTRIYDGDTPRLSPIGEPVTLEVITPATQVEILDTWYTMGLRGTGSNNYRMRDVFVPDRHTFQMGGPLLQPGLLYRLPHAWGFPLAIPALGIGRAAVDAMKGLCTTHRTHVGGELWRDSPVIQREVGRAESLLETGRGAFRQALQEMWAALVAGQEVTPEQALRTSLTAAQAVYSSAQAVEAVFVAAGGSAVYAKNPLERRLRDILTLRQHTGFGVDRLRRLGAELLGTGGPV